MMEFVSWDDDIPNIWKNKKKKSSKPPTGMYLSSKYRVNIIMIIRIKQHIRIKEYSGTMGILEDIII